MLVSASARATRSRLPLILQPLGGLLVISGPPLGGKGPLAARLHDQLPGSVKLEAADNLETRWPGGSRGGSTGEEGLLKEAARRLAPGRGRLAPIVILCARFPTLRLRSRAAAVAKELRVRFLLVEAASSTLFSLRRLSKMFLTAEEAAARLERYRLGVEAYAKVSASERQRLPALTLDSVLGDLDDATARVVDTWIGNRG